MILIMNIFPIPVTIVYTFMSLDVDFLFSSVSVNQAFSVAFHSVDTADLSNVNGNVVRR